MGKKLAIAFGIAIIVISSCIWVILDVRKSLLSQEEEIRGELTRAFAKLEEGKEAFLGWRFGTAETAFGDSHAILSDLKESVGLAFPLALRVAKYLPEESRIAKALQFSAAFEKVPLHAKEVAYRAGKLAGKLPAGLFDQTHQYMTEFDGIHREVAGLERAMQDLNRVRVPGLSYDALRASDLLGKSREGLDALRWMLGGDGRRTYVLLFQNPAELRPTGGFISSFGVVSLEGGHFKDFKFYHMADLDATTTLKIIPPRPLRRIARSWVPSDANWFVDFPLSSRKLDRFLSDAMKLDADGIVALNPGAVANLLGFVGPIEMPEYKVTLDAVNFYEQAQIQTRLDQERKQPKRFLELFGKRVLEKLKTIPSDKLQLFTALAIENLETKEIQLFVKNPAAQQFVLERGWGGQVKSLADEDYLAIVHTNIGGEKSDYWMRQDWTLKTRIEADGTIVNTLTLTRRHTGNKAKYSWWRAKNYDYLRVYTPLGAELVSAKGGDVEPTFKQMNYERAAYLIDQDIGVLNGYEPLLVGKSRTIEVYEELEHTVFATWLLTDAGKESVFEITYRLPFKTGYASPAYRILIEKQSGLHSTFRHAIEFFEGALNVKGDPTASGVLEKNIRRSISFTFPRPQ